MEIPLAESRFIKYGFYIYFAVTVLIIAAIAARVSWVWALLLIPASFYALRVLRRDIRLAAPDSIVALRLASDRRMFGNIAGEWRPCEVKSWWAGQRLAALSLRCGGGSHWRGSRSILIDRHVLQPDHYRRLRVWLRGMAD